MALTTLKSIQTALDQVESKKENLRKAFQELQLHSSLLSSFAFTWNDVETYIESTQSDLLQKFSDLQAQESMKIRKPKPVNIYASDPVPARPELKSLCENMDGLGLRKYVLDRPKERNAVRLELADALKHASDPGSLILDALDGFCAGSDSVSGPELGALRRACAVLLEEFMRGGFEIGAEVKQRAAAIAAEWKGKMASVSDGDGGDEDEDKKEEMGGLDWLLYLQLLAAYKLVSDGGYDANELINHVVMIARCRQAVELCQALGLDSRVSDIYVVILPCSVLKFEIEQLCSWLSTDIVQKLIVKGKQLLALKFIFEFELTDEFPPVPLLKAYVNNSEKLAQKVRKSGKGSRQSLNEAATIEINALKAVIKCIEDHGLESQYSKLVLLKRIEKLEKEKGDRKRIAPVAIPKPQQNLKRPLQNGNKRIRAASGRRIPPKPVVPPPHPSLMHRSGLFPDYTAPYLSSSAGAYAAAAVPYAGSSAGVYGLSGAPPLGYNPTASGSYAIEPHAQQPHVQPGYYDGAVGYGGYSIPSQYQPVYYQQ
ncbi:FRIGIDA-like protein 1-like [Dorcoceras hygrometricum]|uniref:FRIGIDA-like protein n=1 Tax=Dorcoceras hygrometricum TaxID=472368 RepID=A0A2Z7BPG4_9LAMI|nr:FRIGIDA-like protein 1-like [Dorcoceras hygrometricum]